MNWRVLLGGLLLVFPLVWVLASGFGKDPSYIPCPLIDKPAPRFELPVLDGDGATVKLTDYLGKPVVVNFWATWCDTCRIEHPTLLSLARTYEGRVQFLGIAYLDTEPKLRAWLRAAGGQAFPALIDVGSTAAVAYGVGRLPETYLVDKTGVIRKKYFGAINPGEFIPDLEEVL
ncbi:membrane protein [Deltaproteobacteria bacterium]|nr:membrane protein [Deltaproteobacteria bacterium]